ncbi:hypothetical protein LAV77_05010 [Priestia megaterium]|uniref:hypothetical protein n=1 Tax=Priestia megaterium TaxID=1404 RepID=UPI002B251DCB|nr:hypothetical protein [Priestia megaterium]MEB2264154.1 hypothetical protein [Priestia megaterium]
MEQGAYQFASIMKNKLKTLFPDWCADYEKSKYSTILTDDLDSLMTCAIERHVKSNDINYFYNFNELYVSDRSDKRKPIGCDLALVKGRSWCNHVVRIKKDDTVNPQTANINALLKVSRENYTKKYAGSAALTAWSYYDLPLPKTREGQLLLMSIDSAYLGHYSPYFKSTHNAYLDMMGFPQLIDLLNNTTVKEFKDIKQKYNTYSKIKLDPHGNLTTQLNLQEIQKLFDFEIALPERQFQLRNKFEYVKDENITNTDSKDGIPNLISFALVYKNTASYTKI